MASIEDSGFDKYTIFYEKHKGTKGQYHTKWVEGFIDRCDGKGDEDASWSRAKKSTRRDTCRCLGAFSTPLP